MPTDHYYSFDRLNWGRENEDNKSYRFETLNSSIFDCKIKNRLKLFRNYLYR